MSRGKERLLRVETALTPSQAVVLWMGEAHAYHSVLDYARWLHHQPESAYPLVQLPRQVEEAVRRAMRGQAREETDRAVRAAIKDVAFLFQLHQQANEKVMTEQRFLALLVAFLGTTCPERPGAASRRSGWPPDWKGQMEQAMFALYCLRETVSLISERYFSGNDVLFPDIRETFDFIVNGLDALVEILNDELRMGAGSQRPTGKKRPVATLGREKILQAARPAATREAERLADAAKAWALRAAGEHRAANALLDERIADILEGPTQRGRDR